jgi:ABC-type oligopeptide transport system substrate-binding subunit
MKKLLSIICCAMVLLSVSSCTKQYVTPNPNQTILLNLAASSWTTSDNGKTWSATINAPEIDSYFNDHGGVLVYFSFTDGVYEQIPETYQGVSYSYTHNPGAIAVYAQASDGVSTITAPDAAVVKIVLVDSK